MSRRSFSSQQPRSNPCACIDLSSQHHRFRPPCILVRALESLICDFLLLTILISSLSITRSLFYTAWWCTDYMFESSQSRPLQNVLSLAGFHSILHIPHLLSLIKRTHDTCHRHARLLIMFQFITKELSKPIDDSHLFDMFHIRLLCMERCKILNALLQTLQKAHYWFALIW